jgi:hypothetical protein
MTEKVLPLSYGLPPVTVPIAGVSSPRKDPDRLSFPHAQDVALGGCIMPLFPAKKARVYECSICRENRIKWTRKHPEEKVLP